MTNPKMSILLPRGLVNSLDYVMSCKSLITLEPKH